MGKVEQLMLDGGLFLVFGRGDCSGEEPKSPKTEQRHIPSNSRGLGCKRKRLEPLEPLLTVLKL